MDLFFSLLLLSHILMQNKQKQKNRHKYIEWFDETHFLLFQYRITPHTPIHSTANGRKEFLAREKRREVWVDERGREEKHIYT